MSYDEYESTFEGYMMFRMSEAEHVAKNYPHWTEESANPEYEKFLFDAYDASLKTNSQVD